MISFDWVQFTVVLISLIGVLAAWYTAYLNWKTRPVFLAAKEKHSADLKNVLDSLKTELCGVFPNENLPYAEEPSTLRLPVEERVLFKDLQNHLHSEAKVLSHLQIVKDNWSDLLSQKTKTYRSLVSYLEANTGEKVLDSKKSNFPQFDGITENCLRWLFPYVVSLARGNDVASPQIAYDNNSLIVNGSICYRGSSISQVGKLIELNIRLINQAQPSSPEHDMLFQVLKLIEIQKKFNSLKDELLRLIDEAQSVPILAGNCSYIKRALKS